MEVAKETNLNFPKNVMQGQQIAKFEISRDNAS